MTFNLHDMAASGKSMTRSNGYTLPTSQVVRCWPLKSRVWHFGNPCAVFPHKRPITWFWFSQALFRCDVDLRIRPLSSCSPVHWCCQMLSAPCWVHQAARSVLVVFSRPCWARAAPSSSAVNSAPMGLRTSSSAAKSKYCPSFAVICVACGGDIW